MTDKIAVLVDTCGDIPEEYLVKEGVFQLPMQIIFKDATYWDRETITAQEAYSRLATEIPKTSLPTGEKITEVFNQMVEQGYNKVISLSVSSGLSGTYNLLKLMAEDETRLEFHLIDSKNVAVAIGLVAVHAKDRVDSGKTFAEVVAETERVNANTKVFFSIPTLEYLQKGGRIGYVASLLGGVLKLNPIITCNEDGVYITVGKVRGRKKSWEQTLKLAKEYLGDSQNFLLAVGHGNDEEAGQLMVKRISEEGIKPAKEFFGQISPSLGIHTGPGLVGIAIAKLD